MTRVFPVEPSDGWHAGDLAYCVNATARGCSPSLERGRVYQVTSAFRPRNIGNHGLSLAGVSTGEYVGFWSNRFIKLGPVRGRLRDIEAATRYDTAHYWPACPRRPKA